MNSRHVDNECVPYSVFLSVRVTHHLEKEWHMWHVRFKLHS